jgi:hypothetical protein
LQKRLTTHKNLHKLTRGRKDIEKPINLIILLTPTTQEEVWFKNMIGDTDLKQIWCNDIQTFKNKYYESN